MTQRQSWALFCATGLDVRGLNLSVDIATDLISRSKRGENIVSDLQSLGATGTPKVKADYSEVWESACVAGMKAAETHNPRPMVVETLLSPVDDSSPVKERYYVADGVCGFAWIKVKGNTSFGRWAKKHAGFRKTYPTGLSYWVSQFGQSYEKKLAFATAATKILNDNNIKAYADGRLD